MDTKLAAGLLTIFAAVACARTAVTEPRSAIAALEDEHSATAFANAVPDAGRWANEFVRMTAAAEGGMREDAPAVAMAD